MTVLIYIVTIMLTVGGMALLGFVVSERAAVRAKEKKPLVPKTNFPEPGVCQCGDALCYHGGTGCLVTNCKCQRYIPSDIEPEQMAALADLGMHRVMLEAADAKTKYLAKAKEAEDQIKIYRARY